MKNIIKNKNGFTLIEAVVTLVVMSILFGVGAQILNTTMYSWNMVNHHKDMLYGSRLSMTRMLFDIRHADISQITTFDPTHFVFVDINNKGHNFFLSGTTLLKDGRILADSLQSGTGVQFSYLDPNGNVASTAADIRRVKVRLNFQKGGQTLSLESETRIRNL
jgi:prepilin-type N-terminal cleavage/methylation domain-containing protein